MKSKRKHQAGTKKVLIKFKTTVLDYLTELAKFRDEPRNKTITTIIEEYIEEARKTNVQ